VIQDWHEEASAELSEGARYYGASGGAELGDRFIDGVENAVARALRGPEVPRDLGSGCRRYFVRHFPFAVIYRAEGDRLRIYAVMHLNRRPGYWKDRLDEPSSL